MDYPIIFIPGLFGSLGDDVIKGTGNFSFGLAERVYRPFIEILNSMGYEEGINLFISYYDWKKPVLEATEKYLSPTIEKVKRKTGMSKVILIGHSLGGLLARSYIEYFSPSSVDKLIMIGTPNLGSIDAYYFWSGGKLPYPKVEENLLYNGLKIAFIIYYHLFLKINYIEVLRDKFPVTKDLLPSYGYGNYLLYKKGETKKEIPIEDMTISNSFLNGMEKNPISRDNLFIISGKGVYTNQKFIVDKNNKEKIKWADGKPNNVYKTTYGDGTVTTVSTLGNLCKNNITLEGNHIDILYKSKDYLSHILCKDINEKIERQEVEKIYVIFGHNCRKINVRTPNLNEVSSESINITDSRVQAVNLSFNRFWIMAAGNKNLEIDLDIEPIKRVKPQIYMAIIDKEGAKFEFNPLKNKI
ncbi:alpha/beta fold hydrolase [Tissierella sp. MSJ-40]|uniref:Alpha/beta fold hydrolase n=1 Tax=Tissierella simiarum TaxID=2841534 RepID=A0ABS6E517_9FIRM|nr:alpha/beta fold hydrolase [Tissierella simiarum]MBU5437854.1 alpha/beta fold hydrolase [Tissierella simiarum]